MLGFPGGNLTYYLPPTITPIASVSTTTPYPFSFIQTVIIIAFSVTFSGTITGTDTFTCTIYKNGFATGLSITLNNLSPSTVDINNIGVTTTIANVYPVLILDDVNSDDQFASGTQSANVVGQTSGVNGRNDFGGTSRITNIIYPDLVRDSGAVIYLENLAPFQLSNTSHETIKLVIKF
jgi:hypothetical protein